MKEAPTYRRGQECRRGSTTLRQKLGPEERFETLAQQLIEACDKVKCDPDEYITGMRYILGEIEIAIQAAKETYPSAARVVS